MNLTLEQLHNIRSSLGTIMMSSTAVRAYIPERMQLFFNMIEDHVDQCLQILNELEKE